LEASTADEATAEDAATAVNASDEITCTKDVGAQVLPEFAKEHNELYIGAEYRFDAQEASTSDQAASKSTTSRDPS
jgi:hypothetical protein